MKHFIIILLFFLIPPITKACSCRGIQDYYSFLKNAQTCFVGKVVKETNYENYSIYKLYILDKLKNKIPDTVLINTKYSSTGCRAYLKKNEIYLIQPSVTKEGFNLQRCNFVKNSADPNFKVDTSLIKLMCKNDFSVSSPYFKGEVKNGKQTGKWCFYYNEDTTKIAEEGVFRNGKRIGKWKDHESEYYYRNGKLVRQVSVIDDSLNITEEIKGNTRYLHYSNGKIYKKLTRKKYYSYYPSGALKELANVNAHDFFYKCWIKYNEDGSVKEKVILPDNNDIDARYEFYFLK